MSTVDLNKLVQEMHEGVTALREQDAKREAQISKYGEELGETRAKMLEINEAIQGFKKQYDSERKAPSLGGQAPEGARTPEMEARRAAIETYMRRGVSELSREERTLLGSADAEGGFAVPDDMASEILMNAYDQAEMLQYVNQGTTGRDRVAVPILAKPAVAWGLAGVDLSIGTMDMGNNTMPVQPLTALQLINEDTLNDAEADIAGELIMAFGEAVAEAIDDAIVAGTGGNNQPLGVTVHSTIQTQYAASGVAAALTDSTHNGFDACLTALYGLKKNYRRNATWAMSSATELVIRIVKDAEGRYMWQAPIQAGDPATFFGRPVANAEGMPSIAANAFPIAVGDFRRYWVRNRSGVVIQRLNERYAEKNQVGFKLRRRVAGQPVLPEAFRLVKIATS